MSDLTNVCTLKNNLTSNKWEVHYSAYVLFSHNQDQLQDVIHNPLIVKKQL